MAGGPDDRTASRRRGRQANHNAAKGAHPHDSVPETPRPKPRFRAGTGGRSAREQGRSPVDGRAGSCSPAMSRERTHRSQRFEARPAPQHIDRSHDGGKNIAATARGNVRWAQRAPVTVTPTMPTMARPGVP
jgi:hypothetical protein